MADNGDFRSRGDASARKNGATATQLGATMNLGKILSEHAALFSGDNAISPSTLAQHAVLPPEASGAPAGAHSRQFFGVDASSYQQTPVGGLGAAMRAAAGHLDALQAARAPSANASPANNGSGAAGLGLDGYTSPSALAGSATADDTRLGGANLRHVLNQVVDRSASTASSGNTLAAVLGGIARTDRLVQQPQQALGGIGVGGSPQQHLLQAAVGGSGLSVNGNSLVGNMVRVGRKEVLTCSCSREYFPVRGTVQDVCRMISESFEISCELATYIPSVSPFAFLSVARSNVLGPNFTIFLFELIMETVGPSATRVPPRDFSHAV